MLLGLWPVCKSHRGPGSAPAPLPPGLAAHQQDAGCCGLGLTGASSAGCDLKVWRPWGLCLLGRRLPLSCAPCPGVGCCGSWFGFSSHCLAKGAGTWAVATSAGLAPVLSPGRSGGTGSRVASCHLTFLCYKVVGTPDPTGSVCGALSGLRPLRPSWLVQGVPGLAGAHFLPSPASPLLGLVGAFTGFLRNGLGSLGPVPWCQKYGKSLRDPDVIEDAPSETVNRGRCSSACGWVPLLGGEAGLGTGSPRPPLRGQGTGSPGRESSFYIHGQCHDFLFPRHCHHTESKSQETERAAGTLRSTAVTEVLAAWRERAWASGASQGRGLDQSGCLARMAGAGQHGSGS